MRSSSTHRSTCNRIVELDVDEPARCVVEPGIVLDDLNRQLKPHGLWFPVDVSTASRATIGGMTGNNSCGARSIRYGIMRDNVLAIDALLADGHRGPFRPRQVQLPVSPDCACRDLLALGAREAGRDRPRAFPRCCAASAATTSMRWCRTDQPNNLAHLLVGSEGTLACSDQHRRSNCHRCRRSKALGVCHFPTFHAAMDAAQHLVKLDPVAVELVDRTMIELARDIAMFRPTIEEFVRGEPDALLLVEFAEDDWNENLRRLKQLHQVMGDLGFDWSRPGDHSAAWSRSMIRACRQICGSAQVRPQHHDVDEGGGQTGLLRRGLRRAAGGSGRLHRTA